MQNQKMKLILWWPRTFTLLQPFYRISCSNHLAKSTISENLQVLSVCRAARHSRSRGLRTTINDLTVSSSRLEHTEHPLTSRGHVASPMEITQFFEKIPIVKSGCGRPQIRIGRCVLIVYRAKSQGKTTSVRF